MRERRFVGTDPGNPAPARLPLARYRPWLIVLLALAGVTCYIAGTYYSRGWLGFPLDDAWIHQTYARNLAQSGQLAYLPGQPSAGSTSPAWSFLLSVGYMLGVDPRLWAYLWGAVSLAAAGWLTYRLLLRLDARRLTAALLAGSLAAVEWHLVWAAASGMETILFTALTLALIEYFFSQVSARRSPQVPGAMQREQAIVSAIGIGLLGGVLTFTRPEGLALTALVIGGLLLFPPPSRAEINFRLMTGAVSLLALVLILTPYLWFNWNTAGSIFPNTFYAKQAEYRLAGGFLARFWRVLRPTLVGAQVLLLPGFGHALYRLARRRDWPALLPFVWWLGFLIVYAWRLPVAYQHGRYAIPTIPILILYGVWGTAGLLQPRSAHLAVRVLSRAAPLALAALALLFWFRGGIAYRDDVGFIENEMVAMSRWLNEHTATEALIAVHDIGAVGYLTDRPLLDLAGLISPQVIPFISDAERLMDWMLAQGADYAVFFPDFSPTYARLAADPRLEVVYCTGYAWTRAQGRENLCAYRLLVGSQP